MVKIRPRRPDGGADDPAHEWHDDAAIDGAAAFGPRDDPDPFGKAFAESRRPDLAGRSDGRGPRAGLAVAAIVLLLGVLAVALGLADDGDDDVATVESTSSTTSTSRPRVTTTSSVTSTTALTSTSLGIATTTTALGATVTTLRPTTTLPSPSTTQANQPLTITISVPPDPVVGAATPVTVTLTDPDAEPTTNCFVVEIEGESDPVLEDPCDEEADVCPGADDPAIGPSGATRTVDFFVTFDSAGQHTITVAGRSGVPERCNRYADRATEEINVTVGPAP